MRASFPSQAFPPLTALSLEVPEGWEPDVAAGTLMCLFDPGSPQHFRTNAIVQVERTIAGVPVDVFAAQVAERTAAGDPTFAIQGEEYHEIGGHRALMRLQTFEPAGVSFAVFQAELLLVVPTANERCADLVQLHASCAADAADRYGATFRSLIDSIALDGA